MNKSGDLQAVVDLVRKHGYTNVIRSASYLWGVAKFIEAHNGRAPGSVRELAGWWHEPYRTTQREGTSWAKVMDGADVEVIARRVLADLASDRSISRDLGEADRLRLAAYLAV